MKKLTAILLLSVGILVALGLVMLFSSTTNEPRSSRVGLQLCWAALGGILVLLLSFVDYNQFTRFHVVEVVLALSLLSLVAVLIPGIGALKNGARRWLPLGQPSEGAKLALVLFQASYASKYQARMRERNVGFAFPGSMAALVALLIFAEPDWGTAGLVTVVALAMLAIGGADLGYVISTAVIGAGLFLLLLLSDPLRLDRVLAFLDPEGCRDGAGWQGWQSVLSLGRGGWLGSALGEGSQKNGFVPEQQTDFVLSLIGEESGLAGTLLVVLLFVTILICGACVAWRVADPFGKHLAAGITLLITLQAMINIAVVTSSIPNKGIALPFVSYGGSSLVCSLAAVGLLASVARYGSRSETYSP